MLTPTAGTIFTIEQMLAEPIKHNSELGYYMNFVNLLDMAALAIPTTFTQKGRPFGVTLSAAAFTDRRLLSIANRLSVLTQLTLATTQQPATINKASSVSRTDRMNIVVCGAHLDGLPLNYQLKERGAVLITKTHTSKNYQLHALDGGTVKRPALVKTKTADGAAIEVEVWGVPIQEVGSFLSQIPSPLGLGRVTLEDGSEETGFIADTTALEGATNITEFGGWRAYMKA